MTKGVPLEPRGDDAAAKPDKIERGPGNDHPTVKPLDLMRYLIRLVTPPGGTTLDMFVGSGTSLWAAKEEGFNAIGIDLDEHHCKIAAGRLRQEVLFDHEMNDQ